MDRGTFEALKTFLNPAVHMYQGGREQMSPHKMLGMTLFFLGSKLPYFQMSGIFWVSSECFIRSTNYIIQLLNKKCLDVRRKTIRRFQRTLMKPEKDSSQM